MGHAASLPTAQAHLNKPSAADLPFHMCAEPDSGDEGQELTSAEENAVLRMLHDLRMVEAAPPQQLLDNFPPELLSIIATTLNVDALQNLSRTCSQLARVVRQTVQDLLDSSVGALDILVDEEHTAAMQACVQDGSSLRNSSEIIRTTGEQLFVLLDGSGIVRGLVGDGPSDGLSIGELGVREYHLRETGTIPDYAQCRLWRAEYPSVEELVFSNPKELHARLRDLCEDLSAIAHVRFRLLSLYFAREERVLGPGAELELREQSAACAAIHRWLRAMHKHRFVVGPCGGWGPPLCEIYNRRGDKLDPDMYGYKPRSA